MGYFKTLGVVIAAVAAAGVLIAATPASATVLCKTASSSSCGAENKYAPGTKLKGELASGSTFNVDNGAEKKYFECTASVFEGTVENAGGTGTVSGRMETLDFTNCAPSGVFVLKWGTFELHWISETNNATVTLKGGEYTYIRAGVHCTYATQAGGSDAGTLTASGSSTSHATWDFNMPVTRVQGTLLCPSSLTFTAQYTVTTPVPLYVTES